MIGKRRNRGGGGANNAEQARFLRASADIVKSSAAILNFSRRGRLERERKFYRGGE